MLFGARYGFLLLILVFCGCFHLSIALLVVDFVGTKNQNEQQKAKNIQMEARLNDKIRYSALVFNI